MSTTPGETEAEEIERSTREEVPLTTFLTRLGRAINWVLTRPRDTPHDDAR